MSMNNVNNASHAERRCRIMRRTYGKRYRQTTKVILEVFAPWWITTPTTSRTEKRKSDRRSQTRPEHLWSGKTRVEKKNSYIGGTQHIPRNRETYSGKHLKLRHEGGEQDKITNKKSSTTENVKKKSPAKPETRHNSEVNYITGIPKMPRTWIHL